MRVFRATLGSAISRLVPPASLPARATGERKQALMRLRDTVILPYVARVPLGRPVRVGCEVLSPDAHQQMRQDILELFSRGPAATLRGLRGTVYFRHQQARTGSLPRALWKTWRYHRLYRSLASHGWRISGEAHELPWLFAAEGLVYRFDGMHRATIARFLGHRTVPVLLITPASIRAAVPVPADVASFLDALAEPSDLAVTPFTGAGDG